MIIYTECEVIFFNIEMVLGSKQDVLPKLTERVKVLVEGFVSRGFELESQLYV